MSRIRRMYWHEADVIGDNPAIKNHTATLVGRYVLVFGGYDGHLNHNDVHALDTVTMRWKYKCKVSGTKPRGRNGHTATLAPGCRHEASALHVSTTVAPAAAAAADDADESRDSAAQKSNGESQSRAAANDDGATDVGAESDPSEGDGGRTESTGNDIALTKGRDSGCLHDRIFVVGGWLGRGPLAADDIHILHVRMCDVDGDGDERELARREDHRPVARAANHPPERRQHLVLLRAARGLGTTGGSHARRGARSRGPAAAGGGVEAVESFRS